MASKKCPQCAEKVQAAAKVCRYCHYEFPAKPKAPPPTAGAQATALGCTLLLVVAVGFLFLKACSWLTSASENTTNTSLNEPDPFMIKVTAEDNVKASLKDPDSATFQSEFVSKLSNGGFVLCGEVNAKNGFGGYTGFARFIAGMNSEAPTLIEGESTGLGEKIDRTLFPTAYAKFCSHPVKRFEY